MKIPVRTKVYNAGTIDKPENLPYLAGIERTVGFSMLKIAFPSDIIIRAAGTPAQIATIKADTEITVLTDNEAQAIIQSKYPDSDLENFDITDPEIDEIAKTQGLDPKLRADIIIPTRGKQLLQDQENYLMSHICTKKQKNKKYWNDEAKKSTKWATGKDIENDILDGKQEAHEFVLSRLR